jgi:hypothetical protein
MKFIFADSLDLVDPDYDFLADRPRAGRQAQQDDKYPHELMNPPPYDGVLVSRGIVGDHRFPGKYSSAQAMRFRRDGARKFLRLDAPRFKSMPIYGDSGAFSYVKEDIPPYTPEQILEFYSDSGFTHGCSVDHIIFEFDREERGRARGTEHARRRFEITLQNARDFLKRSASLGRNFTPIGVAQGWSPSSIAAAASKLEKMGYSYIALGGLVPLRAHDVHRCLTAVRERISSKTRIHLLGFAKAEQIGQFVPHKIESFDSTSPLLRAFKDARSNFYVLANGGLEYYSAIRIPQALENPRLARAAKEGKFNQEKLLELERKALSAVRNCDRGLIAPADAADCVADYGCLLADDASEGSQDREALRASIRESTERTLRERPWASCPCEICKAASVEVIIYRSSNRNKRRGFHNLGIFFQHVRRLLDKDLVSEAFEVPRLARAAKR